jgi:hypothetical protein
VHGGAQRNAGDGRFSQGCIYDTLLTKLIYKALGGQEYAAALADVLAHDEDTGVAPHLFQHGLADGFYD